MTGSQLHTIGQLNYLCIIHLIAHYAQLISIFSSNHRFPLNSTKSFSSLSANIWNNLPLEIRLLTP